MITAKSFFEDFFEEEFNVVAFYPYTSVVIIRLAETNWNCKCEIEEELNAFFEKYMQKAEELGARRDNKVVIELSPKNIGGWSNTFFKKMNIFVGMYDNQVSIGLGVFQPDSWTQKYNMYINDEGKLVK